MKHLSILGSTGSIGKSTLDVIARHPDKFRVVGLAEGHDIALLAEQIEKFKPSFVSVRDESSAKLLSQRLSGYRPEIVFGISGASMVASLEDADTVVSAIVGAAGLKPTIAAIEAKKTLALANKEALVVAGSLVTLLAKKNNVKILPIDSEHSALFQSLEGHRIEDVERMILTASGGPFLRASFEEIKSATPEMALKHPRWDMGAKITIDSATLMNKGLEVIEARWLYDMPPSKIDVVVHPQSIVHSMIEYIDGCVMAELGEPDMRAPIAYAISYPERVASGVKRLDLAKIGQLTFEAPDTKRFPALKLAYEALSAGASMPAVLNAANEIAVAAFLEKKIGFLDIARIVEKVMSTHTPVKDFTIDDIMKIDGEARKKTTEMLT